MFKKLFSLKFTPLEFETHYEQPFQMQEKHVKIYSVGV